MLGLIGGLIGIFTSAIPELLKLWKQRNDQKHELEIFKLQLERDKLGHLYQMEELGAEMDIAEGAQLVDRPKVQTSGVKFLDAILIFWSSSVRPAIAYSVTAFYALAKIGQFTLLKADMASGLSTPELIWKMWGSEDMAIFSMILGFYFGQRSMVKAFKYFVGEPK